MLYKVYRYLNHFISKKFKKKKFKVQNINIFENLSFKKLKFLYNICI